MFKSVNLSNILISKSYTFNGLLETGWSGNLIEKIVNDKLQIILANYTSFIDGNSTTKIKGNSDNLTEGNVTTTINGTQATTVLGSDTETISGSKQITAATLMLN